MPTTGTYGWPFPDDASAFTVDDHIEDLAEAIENTLSDGTDNLTVNAVTTTAGVTVGTDLAVGDDVTVTGDVAITGTLSAGSAMQPQTDEDATDTTCSSATFVDQGANLASVVFTAPPSGRVLICVDYVLILTISANATRTLNGSWELREGAVVGSGTVVTSPSDTTGIQARCTLSGQTDGASGGSTWLQTGLTPGASYNVRTMFRLSSTASITTATDANRRLTVIPML